MKKEVTEQIKKDRERYRELCRKEPSICIFLKDYWQDAVCENDQWSAVLYEKNGVILGSLVFCYRKKTRGIEICQPILTQTNGVWIREFTGKTTSKRLEYEKEVYTGLIAELEKLPIVNYSQNFTIEITNWLPFYWKGYRQTTKYSYRIMDITNAEDAISRFSKAKRRDIHHAQKSGLIYQFDLPPQQFYAMLVRSYAMRGKKLVYTYQQFSLILYMQLSHYR